MSDKKKEKKEYKGNPWELQEWESQIQYEYFVIYRDISSKRTLPKAAEIAGVSKDLLGQYSTNNQWIERVRAYDMYIDERKLKAKLEAVEDMERRHVQHIKATENALMLPVKELIKRINIDPNALGNISINDLLELVNKNSNSLVKVMDSERKTHNQATDIVRNEFSENGPAPIIITPNLSGKQLERWEKKKREEEESDESES